MSKNFYQYADPNARLISVDVGYDRPCRHLYLNVTLLPLAETSAGEDGPDEDGADEEMLYCSMYDPALAGAERGAFRFGLTVDELEDKLRALALRVPDGLIASLNDQMRREAGNEIRTFTF